MSLTASTPILDQVDRFKIRTIRVVLIIIPISAVIAMVLFTPFVSNFPWLPWALAAWVALSLGVAYLGSRVLRHRLPLVSWLIVFYVVVNGIGFFLTGSEFLSRTSLASYMIALLLAAFLLGPKGAVRVYVIIMVTMGTILILQRFTVRPTKQDSVLYTQSFNTDAGLLFNSIGIIFHNASMLGYELFMLLQLSGEFDERLKREIKLHLDVERANYDNAQLQILLRVGQQTTALLELDPLLKTLVDELQRSFGYDSVTIFLPDEEGKALVAKAAAGNTPRWAIGTAFPINDETKIGEAALSQDLVTFKEGDASVPVTTQICVPLTQSNAEVSRLLGVIDIYHCHESNFKDDGIGMLQVLRHQIAIAIRNTELYEQVRQASNAKTEFISTVNHEIRTPLQGLISSIGFMEDSEYHDNFQLPESYKDDLKDMRDAANYSMYIVDAVLNLNKIEAGKQELEFKSLDTIQLLQHVYSLTKPLVKPAIDFVLDTPKILPMVKADSATLTQVLVNLVSNALKFTDSGYVRLEAQSHDHTLQFVVRDTGIGISPEAQSRLFQPFSQANKDVPHKYGGSGLGLVISKRFVELHGGQIRLESEPGKGTTFIVLIPLANTPESNP